MSIIEEKDLKTNYELIDFHFKKLVGKSLRFVEAALGDKVQRESLKSIIEQEIYNTRNIILAKISDEKLKSL